MTELFNLGLNDKQVDLVLRARAFAIMAHRETNHTYGDEKVCYSYHLQETFDIGLKYIYLVPVSMRGVVLASLWLHDTIEDCRVNYSKIKEIFGEQVAEIVFALTNNKGRTRAERADERYYHGIKAIPLADFCKICDRLANVTYSSRSRGRMFQKYKKENREFLMKIWNPEYTDMYLHLRNLLNPEGQIAKA